MSDYVAAMARVTAGLVRAAGTSRVGLQFQPGGTRLRPG